MSILKHASRKNKTREQVQLQSAVDDVQALILSAGLNNRRKDANQFFSLEGLNQTEAMTIETSLNDLKQQLRGTSLHGLLQSSVQTLPSDIRESRIEAGLEAAAYQIMVSGAPGDALAAMKVQVEAPSGTGRLVMPADGGETYSLESFDANTFQNYIAATAVANAQAAIAGGFEEVFFPQQMIPVGQNGVDVQVTIPKVTTNQLRSLHGAPFALVKTSLIKAVTDPSILESEATTIVPYAEDATNPSYLVPAATIPTFTKNVLGTPVNTRPIAFGTNPDLISLSNYPGLVTVGALDATDSLDPIINVGTLYFSLSITIAPAAAVVAAFAVDVSNQAGSLLTQVPTGRIQKLQTTMDAFVAINKASAQITGNAAAFDAAVESVLGLAGGSEYKIGAVISLAATADTEYGSMNVAVTSSSITTLAHANGDPIALTALTAAGVTVALTPIGYMPQARRTNSNLRSSGTIIDPNTTVTYRFPVNLQPPLVSQSAIGTSSNVTLEGLGHTARLRNNGRCVTAFAALESWLRSHDGIPAQSPVMGEELVKPTLVESTLDVTQYVTTLESMHNIENLRGQLLASLTVLINLALIQSDYLAALQMTTGDVNAFEVIVVADPQLAPYLWESGDIRTFGDNRKFTITTSLNNYFKGKIYFSFRRAGGSDEIHPLDFGRMLTSPSLTYEVPITRNGQTHNEIQTIPRANAYATLPVLGLLTVSGMEALYSNIISPTNPII